MKEVIVSRIKQVYGVEGASAPKGVKEDVNRKTGKPFQGNKRLYLATIDEAQRLFNDCWFDDFTAEDITEALTGVMYKSKDHPKFEATMQIAGAKVYAFHNPDGVLHDKLAGIKAQTQADNKAAFARAKAARAGKVYNGQNAERDAALYADWMDGARVTDLAAQHGISRPRIYAILKREAVRDPANQPQADA